MRTDKNKAERAVIGGFLGLAIGDALGVPVETYSHEDILQLTGGKGVTSYMLPVHTRQDGHTEHLPIGSPSDDTQLARAVSESLIRCDGFDEIDQAMTLVQAYETSSFGWGGTTVAAALAFQKWRDTKGEEGRHPKTSKAPKPEKDGESAGSGPAMKIFPMAAFRLFGRRNEYEHVPFDVDTLDLGRMTHGDIRASVAALALGYTVAELMHAPADADSAYFKTGVPEQIMRRLLDQERLLHGQAVIPPFSAFLAKALGLLDDPTALRQEINTGFLAVHSVPFAIATALRHPNDFRAGVLEGINAGQDTDTVGSMIGAAIGSRVGLAGIPEEWVKGLYGMPTILAEARILSEAIRY